MDHLPEVQFSQGALAVQPGRRRFMTLYCSTKRANRFPRTLLEDAP
jgi:hypothetical protein